MKRGKRVAAYMVIAAGAMAAAQTAMGEAGQAEVKQVNVYIGGEKIDERVRGEGLESLRGTARQ